jgi:hypothetical protein
VQAVALAKDRAFRRGHLPMRDDGRQGRVSLICCHCGARATWERGDLRGLLLAEGGKCIGFQPKSRRQIEIEEMDAEEGWTGLSAIAEANWAIRASAAMGRSLARGGR